MDAMRRRRLEIRRLDHRQGADCETVFLPYCARGSRAQMGTAALECVRCGI